MSTNNTPRKPARWSDFEKHLKGYMLEGKTFTLTIARVDFEPFYDKKQKREVTKPVVYFRETNKGLIVEPGGVNADKLIGLFGDDIAACVGQPVALRAEKKMVAGRECEPIYISAANGQAKPAPATSPAPAGEFPRTEAQRQAAVAALFGQPAATEEDKF